MLISSADKYIHAGGRYKKGRSDEDNQSSILNNAEFEVIWYLLLRFIVNSSQIDRITHAKFDEHQIG